MAQNLQLLRRRIRTAKNIAQIAKAMEMISASKIKKAQDAVEKSLPYSEKISQILEKVLLNLDPTQFSHPYLQKNESGKKLLIIFAPDKGLAGALPTNIIRKIMGIADKNTYVITVGKKIERAVSKMELDVIAAFPMGTTLPNYSMVFPLIRIVNEYYLSGKIGKVEILFTEFKSIFAQSPEVKGLLPLTLKVEKAENDQESEYTFEPNARIILEEILPYSLEIKLYHYLIQAFTAEQAARMVSMQNAKNNALDIVDFLTLSYNKARQMKITNELLDLANVHV